MQYKYTKNKTANKAFLLNNIDNVLKGDKLFLIAIFRQYFHSIYKTF